MKPKISIITICYNCENTIETTIKSVVSQTYDNYEYIVVDGASTDGTTAIVKEYKNYIDEYISEKDDGISDAFNKGIKLATGDLIGIVNAGDELYSETTLEEIAAYYFDDIDVFRGRDIVRNVKTGFEYSLTPTMRPIKNLAFFNSCHMGTYITKEAYRRYGDYDTSFMILMDVDLIYRFMRAGARCKLMDISVGLFRLGGISQTNRRQALKETVRIAKRTYGFAWAAVCHITVLTKEFIKLICRCISPDLLRRIRYGVYMKTKA